MPIKRFKGFTLIELIATLVLIAAVAATIGPRFFNVDDFRERGFFDETLSSVRYAQKLAVATGCSVFVDITATGFTFYRAASAATCNTGPYATVVADPSGNATTFTRTAPSGVTLTVKSFTFRSDGSATDGTAATTATVNVNSRQFKVFFDTGFVQRL